MTHAGQGGRKPLHKYPRNNLNFSLSDYRVIGTGTAPKLPQTPRNKPHREPGATPACLLCNLPQYPCKNRAWGRTFLLGARRPGEGNESRDKTCRNTPVKNENACRNTPVTTAPQDNQFYAAGAVSLATNFAHKSDGGLHKYPRNKCPFLHKYPRNKCTNTPVTNLLQVVDYQRSNFPKNTSYKRSKRPFCGLARGGGRSLPAIRACKGIRRRRGNLPQLAAAPGNSPCHGLPALIPL